MSNYGVFIRIDVVADTQEAAVVTAEKALQTIDKPEGFIRWEHYEVEEA
jgi:hypothetical protein